MTQTVFEILSSRVVRGAVMGSPQATTLLLFRVDPPSLERLDQARLQISNLLPQWVPYHSNLKVESSHQPDQAALMLFLDLVIGIQQESGIPVGCVKSSVIPIERLRDGSRVLFLPTYHKQSSHRAIEFSLKFLNSFFDLVDVEPETALDSVRQELTSFVKPGVNSFFIHQAAYSLGIPVLEPVSNLLVLGHGERSRWLQSLVSDLTPMLGMNMAQQKHHTATLLRVAGLPGAIHQVVRSKDEALQAAQSLGYPLVVKPVDADRGQGVSAGLKNAESVIEAFELACKVSPKVLIEKWVDGHTHRLTVQDGRVIRVVRRTAGGVVGDGESTISSLVERFQKSPQQLRLKRRLGHPALTLDEEAKALMAEQGYNPLSIPVSGVYIKLRRRDNLNAGGTNQELDPHNKLLVHPDNVRLAIEASEVLRLDFAGIDLITTDISRSWLDVGGLICEVNACPQMGASHRPDLYKDVLNRLFPKGASIPSELWVVPKDVMLQASLIKRLMKDRPGVCISSVQGLWIGGQQCTKSFKDSFFAAQALLQRREVGHALCFMSPTDIWRQGLPAAQWKEVGMLPKSQFTDQEIQDLSKIQSWLRVAVHRS